MLKKIMHLLAKIIPLDVNSENLLGVKIYSRMLKLKQLLSKISANNKLKWPVVNGNYQVVNQKSQIAVCTLTSEGLRDTIINWDEVAITGSLYTPNLGIESIILNTISNPNIRYLVLCGKDSPIFLAGQALRSLFDYGISPDKRILNAKGHYPVLFNLTIEKIQHFLNQIVLIDYREELNTDLVYKNIQILKKKSPYNPYLNDIASKIAIADEVVFKVLKPIGKKIPLAYDEKGFFVIEINHNRNEIKVKHYYSNNEPGYIIKSHSADALLRTILENNLITQMSHAQYMGAELTKAKIALKNNLQYLQDQPLKTTNQKVNG
jgi:tetrahydromethanopterin S-methyltransferase subunit A